MQRNLYDFPALHKARQQVHGHDHPTKVTAKVTIHHKITNTKCLCRVLWHTALAWLIKHGLSMADDSAIMRLTFAFKLPDGRVRESEKPVSGPSL